MKETALTGVEWRLLSVTTNGETVEPTGTEPNVASVTFADETDDAGSLRFTGAGGCNRIFGSYELSVEGLKIGPIGATRMACPEPEMRLELSFTAGLSKAQSYSINGEELVVTFEGGSMQFRREG